MDCPIEVWKAPNITIKNLGELPCHSCGRPLSEHPQRENAVIDQSWGYAIDPSTFRTEKL